MFSLVRDGRRFPVRLTPGARTALMTLFLAALPLIALADEDDKPQPLDPQTKAIQLWVWGLLGGALLLSGGWYAYRRWKLSRMDTHSLPHNQD